MCYIPADKIATSARFRAGRLKEKEWHPKRLNRCRGMLREPFQSLLSMSPPKKPDKITSQEKLGDFQAERESEAPERRPWSLIEKRSQQAPLLRDTQATPECFELAQRKLNSERHMDKMEILGATVKVLQRKLLCCSFIKSLRGSLMEAISNARQGVATWCFAGNDIGYQG